MRETLRILIVDDSRDDAERIADVLRTARYHVVARRVEAAAAMRSALLASAWDIVVSEYHLPQFDASAAIEVLHETGIDIPLILVSRTLGEDLGVAMMMAGVSDYLLKGNLARLAPAIRRELRQATIRRQAREAAQDLQRKEADLAEVQALAKVGLWQVKFQGDREAWSGSDDFSRVWGHRQDRPSTAKEGLEFVHPEDWSQVSQGWLAAKRGEGRRHEWGVRVVSKGQLKWLHVQSEFTFGPGGEPLEAHGLCQDVTERKQAQTWESHLHRVLRAIREIDKLVVKARDRQHLIWEACAILVAARGYAKAWIVLEPSSGKAMALASAGWGDAFAPFEQRIKGGYRPPCYARTSAAPQQVAVLRPASDCRDCPLGVNSATEVAGVATLRYEQTEYGHIEIRVPEGFVFDADERGLLRELAEDLAFALRTIETEERRRASEEQFRVSFEKAAVGQALTSCDGHFLRVNEALALMLDRSPSELEHKSLADVAHPDDLASILKAMDDLLVAGRSQRLELRHLRKDGSVVWLDLNMALLSSAGGHPEHVIVTFVDRTGSKVSEAALKVQEERLRLAVDGADLGIWQLDIASGQLTLSDRTYAMFGLPPGTPRRHDDLIKSVHEDDRDIVNAALQAALSGSQYNATYRVRLSDGDQRWIAVVGRTYRDATGKPLHIEGVVRDITEQKQLEEQLRQAQKMEAVGKLAGGIAHDFNNILGVIQGRCDLMLKGLKEDDDLFRHTSLIASSSERAAALTRQLLAFSRKQPLVPEVLDLNARIQGLESMLRRLLGECIDVALVLAPDLRLVKADPTQIDQVIINLAVNARDAMPEGGKLLVETANVRLDLAYARKHVAVVPPGPYLMLAVSDTGCGMDKHTIERVFDPFFTTKARGKGTGLGLATVYGIVKQSGGYVWVYSEVGSGSTFKVYLPRTEETATSYQQPSPETESLDGHGERILIVEDDPAMREVVQDVLEGLGYRPTSAADGGEALRTIEEVRPDLLITDCVMPGIGGDLLADQLHKTHPDLRVLFMSGYTDEAAFLHGILRRGSPFLQKPFRTADLAAKVKAVLSRPGGA